MLRHLRVFRFSHISPQSTIFQTISSKSSSSSHPRNRKRKTPTTQCHGLSHYRLTRLRRTTPPLPTSPSLTNALLDTLLQTSLHIHPLPVISSLITHATSLAPHYIPSHHVLVSLFNAVLTEASSQRLTSTFSPADLATETFFRLIHAFQARPSFPLLEAVAAHAASDPLLERRPQRISSVLRAARFTQQKPTPRFIYRCFETCVSALDLPSAVTIMDYAVSNGLYRHHRHPRITDFYHQVMRAAFVTQQYHIVHTAMHEMTRRKIPVGSLADAILLATYIETADERADQLRGSVNKPFPDILHAAIIRAAAKGRDASAVITAYTAFENDLEQSGRTFYNTLSVPATTTLPAYGSLGESALATARADPTMSLFYALRVCVAPEEAYAVFLRLRQKYDYRASSIVYTTIIEAAWKTGKLDLAKRLRVEMQASAAVGYTAPDAVGGVPGGLLGVSNGGRSNRPEFINREDHLM